MSTEDTRPHRIHNPYSAHSHTLVARGGHQDTPDYNMPGALCKISDPGSSAVEKCHFAFRSQQNPISECGQRGKYYLGIDSDNIATTGVGACDPMNPSVACCPAGSVALYCGGGRAGLDESSQDQAVGSVSALPGYICINKSEYMKDIVEPKTNRCDLENPGPASYDYLRTGSTYRNTDKFDKRGHSENSR